VRVCSRDVARHRARQWIGVADRALQFLQKRCSKSIVSLRAPQMVAKASEFSEASRHRASSRDLRNNDAARLTTSGFGCAQRQRAHELQIFFTQNCNVFEFEFCRLARIDFRPSQNTYAKIATSQRRCDSKFTFFSLRAEQPRRTSVLRRELADRWIQQLISTSCECPRVVELVTVTLADLSVVNWSTSAIATLIT